MTRILLVALLALAACAERQQVLPAPAEPAPQAPKPPPEPPPPAAEEPVSVPRGCELNLAGRYRLRGQPGYRFIVEDDGDHLVVRPEARDAGESGIAMVLHRGPQGITGTTVGYGTTAGGKTCPVTFAAEIVACRAGELTLRSRDKVALDESCAITREGEPTEKVLLRD